MTKQQQALLFFYVIGILLLSVFGEAKVIDFYNKYEIVVILLIAAMFIASCYSSYYMYHKSLMKYHENAIIEINKKLNLFYHDLWFLFILVAFVGVISLGLTFTLTGFSIIFISLGVMFNTVILKGKIILENNKLVYSELSLFSKIDLDGDSEIIIDKYQEKIIIYKGEKKVKSISKKIMSDKDWGLLIKQLCSVWR